MTAAPERHALVANVATRGHVYPTLPLVTELVRRGYRVTYTTTAEFADVVAGPDASVLRYDSAVTEVDPAEVFAEDDASARPQREASKEQQTTDARRGLTRPMDRAQCADRSRGR